MMIMTEYREIMRDNRQLLVNSALLIGHLIGRALFHALFRHPIDLN